MSAPLRVATLADASEIAALLRDFNAEFHEPAPSQEALTERLTVLMSTDTVVALIGAPAFGLALLRLRLSLWGSVKECYLAELYVAPAQRGNGHGRRLLEYAMGLARARGADYMDLNTSETDEAARALYESAGFSRREGRPDGPLCYYYEKEL